MVHCSEARTPSGSAAALDSPTSLTALPCFPISTAVLQVDDAGITVGASVTLSSFMDALRGLIKSRPAHETGTCKALVEQMRYFAGESL